MRFEAIEIERFGPFDALSLDLSKPPTGLHILFGANETGKTSFLRAVEALLFGFLPRGEDWKHHYKDFSLSATIVADRGTKLEFTRVKKRSGLRSRDGDAIDESRLHQLLGVESRETFRTLFSLDRQRLKDGGEEIARGAGDLGKLLFTASGLGTAGKLNKWLEDQASALYRPQAEKPVLNTALSNIRDLKSQERKLLLSSEVVSKTHAAKKEADEELERRRATINEMQRARNRIQLVLGVIDDVAHRERLVKELEKVASVVDLKAGTALDAMKAETERRSKGELYTQIQQRIRTKEDELASLQSEEPILVAEDAIERFRQRVNSHVLRRQQVRDSLAQRQSDERKLDTLRRMIATAPPVEEWERLDVRIDDLASLNEVALHQARMEAKAQKDDFEAALRRLSGWRGTAEELLTAATPTRQEVDDWADEFRKRDDERDSMRAKSASKQQDLADAEQAVANFAAARSVPTEEHLNEARRRRDQAFQLLETKIKDGSAIVGDVETLRRAVHDADEIADRLRREADAVAHLNEGKQSCLRLASEVKHIDSDLQDMEEALEVRQLMWRRRWEHLPLDVKKPAVMSSWLEDRQRIIERIERHRECEARWKLLDRQYSERVAELNAVLGRFGMTREANEPIGMGAVRLKRRLASLNADRDRLQQFEESLRLIQDTARFVEEDGERLLQEARQWATTFAIDDPLSDLEQFCDRLYNRLNDARSVQETRQAAERDLAKARKELEKVAKEISDAQSKLEGPFRLAGVTDAEALAKVEEASQEKRRKRAQLEEIELRLQKAAGSRSLDEFIDEVASESTEILKARLAGINERSEAVDKEKDEWLLRSEDANRAFAELQQCGTEAAEARQEVEFALVDAVAHARRFAVYRTAQTLLEATIREYREKNETQVLRRARELFRRLTGGAYSTLRTDNEGAADARLLAVRGEEEVPVECLSEGTRDQLFLSLRLAALEAMFERRGPMPVLADDLLMTFDDERTAAALKTLAEFARDVQVLLLTHHRYVVDAAKANLDFGSYCIHELTLNPPLAQ